ncbi:ABC transporter substrate-binding protein [Jeotgalibacillus aurantiacus]|uniref:ABC transporter substrate-binding protein n=1 Tax=Jeotgalibacillus aurantiacus TaxID=2763266 RepID=UPI001D0BB37D|nr:ABC transporter substrate-binding protein [Jeotgalibacillus aurantiacus]
MKKRLIGTAGILLLAGCNMTSGDQPDQELSELSWDEITAEAEGDTVRLYMWGGDEGINRYIDEYAAPALQEEYDVTLERIPLDTNEIIQKLETEKRAGQDDGTIDIIWMNGENFKRAKEGELLYGPITDQLPAFEEFYDTESLDFAYDFGTETEGYEAPWGKVQFVFHYDSSKIEEPPSTLEELSSWIQENPGRFTYPAADDFTGNAFLRHILYGTASSVDTLLEEPFSEEFAAQEASGMWGYLNEIESDLWRGGETYPGTLEELDRLYSQGEVWMTMGYNEARAESLVADGIFPETTKAFVLEDPGSIGNTHFLSIPYNSPSKEAALTAINFFLTPEAQLAKLDPQYWGENTPINPSKLQGEDQAAFEELDRGGTVLSQEELLESFVPEVDAAYVPWLEDAWINEVVSD